MTNFKNLFNRLKAVLGFHGDHEADVAQHSNRVSLGLLRKTIALTSVFFMLSAFTVTASASEHDEPVKQVFVTLTSAETQTQGMALVLTNAMQAQGAEVELLLCDGAGQLAVTDAPSERLAPRDVSPKMMLKNLMQGGAKVQVCALFLPNAGLSDTDLLEGISAAQPPAIAERLLAEGVRVFNF
ncbi:MAG: DsrE family protein [Idiomarina sp.]|nr:DsrE family protein [Idiomarina sp.]